MTKPNLINAHRYISLPVLCGSLLFPAASLFAQCASSYNDSGSSDDATQLYAWSILADNYTDSSSYCAPVGWQNFIHTYTTSVRIVSPSGRVAYGNGSGQQYGGTGPGMGRADTGISMYDDSGNDEYGDYSVYGTEQIDCSVAGVGFYLSNSSDTETHGFSVSFYENPILQGNFCQYQIVADCNVKCRPIDGHLKVTPSGDCAPNDRYVSVVDWTSKPPHGPADYTCQKIAFPSQSHLWTGAWPSACFDR